MRRPAEVFPPGEYLRNELEARGWSVSDLVSRMGGDTTQNYLAVDLLIHVHDRELLIGVDLAKQLARALGTTAELWQNLERAWREAQPECRALEQEG